MEFDGFQSHTDGVFDGQRGARTVGDNGDAVHSEEGAAAVVLVIGFVADGFEGVFGEEGAELADGIAVELVLEPFEDSGGRGFAGFERHVAGEAIAENDFDGVREKVVPFNVAAEVEFAGFEEAENFFGEFAAFGVFAADGHESDGGVLKLQHMPGKNGAHDRVLEHVNRAGINIGARVNEDADVLLGREVARNARAFDPFEGAKFDGGGGDHRAGVSGTDDGIGLAIFHKINGASERGVFLPADRFDGVIRHVNHLGGVDDFEAAVVAAMAGELGGEDFLIAGEEETGDVGVFAQGENRSFHGVGGSMISAHAIQSDAHG